MQLPPIGTRAYNFQVVHPAGFNPSLCFRQEIYASRMRIVRDALRDTAQMSRRTMPFSLTCDMKIKQSIIWLLGMLTISIVLTAGFSTMLAVYIRGCDDKEHTCTVQVNSSFLRKKPHRKMKMQPLDERGACRYTASDDENTTCSIAPCPFNGPGEFKCWTRWEGDKRRCPMSVQHV